MLTKQFAVVSSKKVNAVGAQILPSRAYESGLEEEAKYSYHELVGLRA